jgi:hypothetical protein
MSRTFGNDGGLFFDDATARDALVAEALDHLGTIEATLLKLEDTPDDKTLLVTSGGGRRLTAFETGLLAKSWDVPLAREPRAVTVTDQIESRCANV